MTEHHTYTIGRRALVLVRPDGSEQRDLGEGEHPVWSPDGETLYFRAADRLWALDVDGGARREIPGTLTGREPAISPGGGRLAYSRAGAGGADIWVLRLEAP